MKSANSLTSVTMLQCVTFRVTVTLLLVLLPVYIYGRNVVTYNIASEHGVNSAGNQTETFHLRDDRTCAPAFTSRANRNLARLLVCEPCVDANYFAQYRGSDVMCLAKYFKETPIRIKCIKKEFSLPPKPTRQIFHFSPT